MFDNSKVSDVTIMKPEPRKEGCFLKAIKKNDDNSVSFTFVDSTNAELTHREFMPSRTIGAKTLTDDEFKKNVGLVHSRIAHITRAFLPEDKFLLIKVDPKLPFEQMWAEYLKQTAMGLGVDFATGAVAAAKGVPAALKVVYRKVKDKYYASLPNIPPFISTANHPKEFSTNPQYDIYEIPTIRPDAEKPMVMEPTLQAQSPIAGGTAQAETQHPSGW